MAASIIPNYLSHVKELKSLAETMEKVHGLDKESEDYCEECGHYVKVMNDFLDDFYAAQEVLFNAIKEKEAGRKIAWFQCGVSIVIGALLSWLVA